MIKYGCGFTPEVRQYHSINSPVHKLTLSARHKGSVCANKAVATDFIYLSRDKDVCVLHRLTIMDKFDLGSSLRTWLSFLPILFDYWTTDHALKEQFKNHFNMTE